MMRTIFTDEDYRARLKRIQEVRQQHKLTLRGSIEFLVRNPPHPSRISLWRAYKRFGEPSITRNEEIELR
jgi:hypothetical protein